MNSSSVELFPVPRCVCVWGHEEHRYTVCSKLHGTYAPVDSAVPVLQASLHLD